MKKANVIKNKIFLGDCCDVLIDFPSNFVDLILTDAPYNVSRKTNFNKGGGNAKKFGGLSMDFGVWDQVGKIDFEKLFQEYKRVLKPGGTLLFFYDIFKMGDIKGFAENFGFKQPRIGIWNKTNAVPINSNINYLSNGREYFIVFCKQKKGVFNSKYDKGFYNYPIVNGKEKTCHTTQKPVKLFEELILKHSNEGDLVLDTFAGSSTTAIACINTKRNWIMIEKDEDYYNLSIQRIEEKL